eukprot:COSAG02_NODE_5824_length_4012_cov_59.380199_7_plen_68_part_00
MALIHSRACITAARFRVLAVRSASLGVLEGQMAPLRRLRRLHLHAARTQTEHRQVHRANLVQILCSH